MKKKTSSNQTQQLSAENYIRQKSKYLPLGDCFINHDWKNTKMCNVIISRKHVNGNITACMYLVDLTCLGVKNTHYMFNIPFHVLKEMMERSKGSGFHFTGISYELAHNIIFAGIEFAEEYGFKPCKEFSSITCHFLEEDDDDVPLIEIECGGQDGKPLYINTGFESPAREKEILRQLGKTAGENNYDFILPGNDDDEVDYDDDDDDEDYDDDFFDDEVEEEEDDDDDDEERIISELLCLNREEQKELFIKLFNQINRNDDLSDEDIVRMATLVDILGYSMTDSDEIEKQYLLMKTKFNYSVIEDDQLPNSLFSGIQNMDDMTLTDLLYDALEEIHNEENPKKTVKLIREKAGDVPIADFLELYYLRTKNRKKFGTLMEKCLQKYPDYFLFQLIQYDYPDMRENTGIKEKLEKLLSERKEAITEFEAEYYFLIYTTYLIFDKNLEYSFLVAFDEYVSELDFMCEDTFTNIQSIVKLCIFNKIVSYLEQTGELKQ